MNRKNLVNALQLVKFAVATRDFQPELKCFQFYPFTVCGYNGEIYVETQFNSGFKCAIPAEPFMKFLSSITDDEVDIKVDDNKVHIRTPHTYIMFPKQDPYEIDPAMSEASDEYIMTEEIYRGLAVCQKFIGKDETQPQYRGVYVDKTAIYATDGFRLARCKVDNDFSVFIPDAFCSMLLLMQPKKLHIYPHHLKCTTRDTRAHSALLGKDYTLPNYAELFMKLDESVASELFPISNMKEVFERADIFTSGLVDKYGKLLFNSDDIQFTVENPSLGFFNSILPIKKKGGAIAALTVDVPLLQTVIETVSHIQIVQTQEYPVLRGVKENFEVYLATIN